MVHTTAIFICDARVENSKRFLPTKVQKYMHYNSINTLKQHLTSGKTLPPCSYIPRDKIIHKLWIIFTAFARVLFCPRPHKENPGYEVGSYSDEQSVDSFPDEESVTETEEDENSENSEDDGEIKEEIDPWATMIDDAKATVRPEYDEFMKTLQMAWMGKKKVQLSRKPLKTFSLNFRKNSLTFTWIIYDG